jgi:hypothetical protein
MGTVVPMVFVKIIVQPYYALRAAEMGPWEYVVKGLGRPLLVGLLFGAVAARIAMDPETSVWLFAATVAAQVSVFLVVGWFFGLTSPERQGVWEYGRQNLLRRVLSRNRQLGPQRAETDLAETVGLSQ